jgi:hypothetical protein
MATHVTSLLRNGPRSFNFRVQICGCRFAMVMIANLRHAWTLFLEYLPVSLNARLARRQIAVAVLIPTRPLWHPSNADELHLSKNRIRLASLGK